MTGSSRPGIRVLQTLDQARARACARKREFRINMNIAVTACGDSHQLTHLVQYAHLWMKLLGRSEEQSAGGVVPTATFEILPWTRIVCVDFVWGTGEDLYAAG